MLVTGNASNPVIVIDEFDKISRNASHDPMLQFHAALEPASAHALTDLYSGVTMDASRVRWIFTANSLVPIPSTLLSRMELIYVSEPGPREMLAIARSVAKAAIGKDAPSGFEPIGRDVAVELAPLPPRAVRMLVSAAIRRAVWAGRNRIILEDLGSKPMGLNTLH
ncbi:AAA family ATPase [Polaromonas sp. P1(28)-13]|nr:AAA family ATPase [Polaromonas sp. P1(28)-13]